MSVWRHTFLVSLTFSSFSAHLCVFVVVTLVSTFVTMGSFQVASCLLLVAYWSVHLVFLIPYCVFGVFLCLLVVLCLLEVVLYVLVYIFCIFVPRIHLFVVS